MNRIAMLLVALLFAASPLQAAEVPDDIAKAVAAPERSAKDRERDAIDKPAELLTFTGVKPGMKVADFLGGGGYWSELIARAVGPTGSVTLVNNPGYYFFSRDGLKERFADGRLKDIRQRVVETGNLDLGTAQFDLIFIFMGYHDLYWIDEANGWPKIDAGGVLDQLNRALKPGGKLLDRRPRREGRHGQFGRRRTASHRRSLRAQGHHEPRLPGRESLAGLPQLHRRPLEGSLRRVYPRQDRPLHAPVPEAVSRPPLQNAEPGCPRNSISSGVEVRPSTSLRCG